jgi:PAS domain-containing protein
VEGVLQSASDPMAVVDGDLRIRAANAAFAELLSAADGWRGRTLTEFVADGREIDELRTFARAEGELPDKPIEMRLPLLNRRPAAELSVRVLPSYDARSSRVLVFTARDGDNGPGATRRPS